jgi:hypothetical protein
MCKLWVVVFSLYLRSVLTFLFLLFCRARLLGHFGTDFTKVNGGFFSFVFSMFKERIYVSFSSIL